MDKRGLTTDPNRERNAETQWWEEIGGTTTPSPYADASWTYWHDFLVESEVVGPGEIANRTFGCIRVYDTRASAPGPGEATTEPEGDFLGEIHYELTGYTLTISQWSHKNWRDDRPVRNAFEVLMNELPECVMVVEVRSGVYDPFWVSLGFVYPFKGSDVLVHRNYYQIVSEY